MTTDTTDKITEQLKNLIGEDVYQDALNYIELNEDDFDAGNYRFIHENVIDDILADELSSDPYVLGCFSASFLSHVTEWPLALIEAAQKGNQYEAIGQALIDQSYVEYLAKEYAKADGYGHHFASYDGEEHSIGDYYVFRIN